MEYIQALIYGQVQGVGFRFHTRRKALSLQLEGWVRNLSDGSVEARGEGTTEGVAAFLEWLHQGPPGARVDRVQVVERGPCEIASGKFTIRSNE